MNATILELCLGSDHILFPFLTPEIQLISKNQLCTEYLVRSTEYGVWAFVFPMSPSGVCVVSTVLRAPYVVCATSSARIIRPLIAFHLPDRGGTGQVAVAALSLRESVPRRGQADRAWRRQLKSPRSTNTNM